MDTIVISGEYPQIAAEIKAILNDVNLIQTSELSSLPAPVRFHADIQCCNLFGRTFVLSNTNMLKKEFMRRGIAFTETENEGQGFYPNDVLCNTLSFGNNLICNQNTIDKNILTFASEHANIVNVKQGYTACSTVKLNESALITADQGIAEAAEKNRISVLKINEGHIKLPGYNYGFIGGCYIRHNKSLIFTGSLSSHPDGNRIRQFIKEQGLSYKELKNDVLLDIGGAVVMPKN